MKEVEVRGLKFCEWDCGVGGEGEGEGEGEEGGVPVGGRLALSQAKGFFLFCSVVLFCFVFYFLFPFSKSPFLILLSPPSAVVFVVDSTSLSSLPSSKKELLKIICGLQEWSSLPPSTPLLVLANKQDSSSPSSSSSPSPSSSSPFPSFTSSPPPSPPSPPPSSSPTPSPTTPSLPLSPTTLAEELGLGVKEGGGGGGNEKGEERRPWLVLGTSGKTGEGVRVALNWLKKEGEIVRERERERELKREREVEWEREVERRREVEREGGWSELASLNLPFSFSFSK